jgi:hypothetical protein
MPVSDDNARQVSVATRLIRVGLTMGAIAAAVVLAFAVGAISLPWNHRGSEEAAPASLAAQQTAANKGWASATCTNILNWKNEIQRDGTSLDFGLGASARLKDAVAATGGMLNELGKLGLPPGAQTAQARAEIERLRSDVESRVRNLKGAADSVASGNLAAIGTLVADLENDKGIGTQIAGELRHVVSVDLGLSLAETPACRELVGIPI